MRKRWKRSGVEGYRLFLIHCSFSGIDMEEITSPGCLVRIPPFEL